MAGERKRWDVFTIREREGQDKKFWLKIGVAFINKDGSFNVYLDSLPLDGKLQIREHVEEEQKGGGQGGSQGGSQGGGQRAKGENEVPF